MAPCISVIAANYLGTSHFISCRKSVKHFFIMLILKLIRSPLVGLLLFGSVLLSGSAWAGTSAIEGVVKDRNGRPINGADIRIEAKTNSSWNKAVKTDAKGHYTSSGLPAGIYRVTLLVAGSVKASINNATVKSGNPTRLDFALKAPAASNTSKSAKEGKHMVWVPARTGSHMGGSWVEVDDSGNGAALMQHVETASPEALRELQSRQTNPTGR
jgi:Carboxypeptidase regulatory-like domain